MFVPDDRRGRRRDAGWLVARATLGNERVSIGGGSGGARCGFSAGTPHQAARRGADRARLRAAGGRVVATSYTLRLLNLRRAAAPSRARSRDRRAT